VAKTDHVKIVTMSFVFISSGDVRVVLLVMQPRDLLKAFFPIIRFSFHVHDGKNHDQIIPVNLVYNRIGLIFYTRSEIDSE
jgi:hypothetical protein